MESSMTFGPATSVTPAAKVFNPVQVVPYANYWRMKAREQADERYRIAEAKGFRVPKRMSAEESAAENARDLWFKQFCQEWMAAATIDDIPTASVSAADDDSDNILSQSEEFIPPF